jgi:hypothetical protein
MPITSIPEGKIVCIGGDGGEYNSTENTAHQKFGK